MKSVKVEVVICNTNMAVPSAISLINALSGRHIVLLSDIENILQLFKEFNYPNVDVIEYSNGSRTGIWSPRRKIMKAMKPYEVEKIYFYHFDFGGLANWYLKKMSKTAEIIFCKLFDREPYETIPFWKCAYKKLNEYVRYGIWMDVHDGGIPSAPKSFYEKISAKTISVEIDKNALKTAVSRLDIPIVSCPILFLTGSVVMGGNVEEHIYTEKVNAIIQRLGKDKLIAKCHPRCHDQFGEEKELKAIPDYIPGNLILYSFNVIIGYNSLLISEAARLNKTAISLLNIVPSINDKRRTGSIRYLEERLEGLGKIYYPSTIDELEKIVSGV